MLELVSNWVKDRSARHALGVFSLVCLAFFLYFWRLGSLVRGFSPSEASERLASSNIHSVISNPLFAPHKIVQWALQHFGFHGPTPMRLVSVIFTLFIIGCFYFVAHSWYGHMIAFFSTLIFLTTPLILLASRSATPDIMYLWIITLAASYTWLLRTRSRLIAAWGTFCLACLIGLYIPGMLWFMIIGLLFVRQKLRIIVRKVPNSMLATCGILFLTLLYPLVWGLYSDHHLVKQLLAIPDGFGSPVVLLKSIGWAFLALFFKASSHTPMLVGRLPLLDISQIALLATGIFAVYSRARHRIYSIVGVVFLSISMSGLYSQPSILLISLPAIGLLVGTGMRFLYLEWKDIFPRNPLAHYFALVLLCSVVGVHMYFGIRYSLIAWPHSVDTNSLYMLK